MIILFFIKHLPTIFQGFVDIIEIPLKLILVKGLRLGLEFSCPITFGTIENTSTKT